MATKNYTTTIRVDKSAREVFNAINHPEKWWSEEIEGVTDQVNGIWTYHFQDIHVCKMKVIDLLPDQKVVWQVLENHFSFTKDKKEWAGNQIIFEITEKENNTEIRFTQEGLTSENECYTICENSWNTYIGKSLYQFIMTGKGEPNGKDQPRTEDEKALSSNNF